MVLIYGLSAGKRVVIVWSMQIFSSGQYLPTETQCQCGDDVSETISTKPLTRRLAVVLGMHRSGTSAMTRGLQTLSFDLGENLMPPVPNDNPTGFFEDLRFYRLNKTILKRINLRWDSLTRADPEILTSRPFLKPRKNAIALLNNQLEQTPSFALKDPRFCQLLAFWKPVFQEACIDPWYIICVRHPFSVAQSLLRRNNIPLADGIFLWFNHMLAAVVDTQGLNRLFVSYDKLLEEPRAELLRLAEAFEMTHPKADAIKQFSDQFLDSGLRHHVVTDTSNSNSGGSYDLILQFYGALADMSCSQPRRPVDLPAGMLDSLTTFRNLIEPLYERIEELKPPLRATNEDSNEMPAKQKD